MQDGLVILDADGCHIFENEALHQMIGFTKDELAGTSAPFPYWPPEEISQIFPAFKKTLAGEIGTFELVFMHKLGKRFWVIISPSVLRDENGTLVGYFATVKDITERKNLERALQESEQRWRSIAENPFDFVVVVDREYRYVYVNHTAHGIDSDALIGKATPFDFTDPIYHEAMRTAYQTTFATGKASSYDVYVPQLDAWYSSIVGPIRENGQVTSISILTREITQQKKAEEALRQTEHQLRESHKMQSIGTLAGGIAHDLNNLLTPILGYSELAQSVLMKGSPASEYIDGIVTAGLRARDLVQRILLFSRRREAKKEQIDLGGHIREGIKLIKASTPSNIDIVLELMDRPFYVYADPSQLHQVLTNLATNALQAMQDSPGHLLISLHEGPFDDSNSDTKEGKASPDSFVYLTVQDSGPGMDAETQRRAFEPFFSTKPIGTGTGLGLSIVHGIVVDHNGTINIRSKPGAGTSFIVSLPLSQALVETHMPLDKTASNKILKPKRILCIDDESDILEVIRQSLQPFDHSLTLVSDPLEALLLFEKDPQAFDLVLSDQTMPKMLGINLVAEIKGRWPALPCIVMTGFQDEEFERNSKAAGVNAILAKPFLPNELRDCVASVSGE